MFIRRFFERLVMIIVMGINMIFGTEFMVQQKSLIATFEDVPVTHWAHVYVESLYDAGITKGCQEEPEKYFCPQGEVSRAEMAIFLLRGIYGDDIDLEPATGRVFNDVSVTHYAAHWIEKLADEGYTQGCQKVPPKYCPENSVTRAEVAIFLLRAKYKDPSYQPDPLNPGENSGFNDVAKNDFAAAWIKKLADEGITKGCGNGKYCPNDPVTREEMAVFLVRTFNLPITDNSDVAVLSNYSHYLDNNEYFHVLGEVANLTEIPLKNVEITLNFYNENDQLLASFDERTVLSTIPSGDKACFDFSINEPIGWAYYEFEAISEWEQGDALPLLLVNDLSQDQSPKDLWYEIAGKVTNHHGALVRNIRPVGTLYNGESEVVGCEWTYTDPVDLYPDDTGLFQMPFLGRDYSDVVEYRIQVEGMP